MKRETIGDILLDLEVVLNKMVEQGLQVGDILHLVYGQLSVHNPEAFEVYEEDGSSPEFSYGPRK